MPKKKRSQPRRPAAAPAQRVLHYKVVELSTVDEGVLERTLNEWVPRGWRFEGVQFAMRESSKRPSMGFVFFTQPGSPLVEQAPEPHRGRDASDVDAVWARLRTFADEGQS